jgi:hypothetical protein
LKFRGEPFAEVWFKPDGEPSALTFRIPRESFDLPDLRPRLTPVNLLKAVGLAAEQVESWRHEGAAGPGGDRPGADLGHPLPPPQGAPHLTLTARLKPPQAAASDESGKPEIPEARWQELEARWNAILAVEASLDTLRLSMETLRAEMEGSSRRALTSEEKLHALNADVAQWNKAKSRALHALPKLREFIHRATWVTGSPERKKLEELLKTHVRPRVPFPEMDRLMEQLDNLLKDRQVLSGHGMSVYQDCKSVSADVQGALRTVQTSAAANATKKRGQTIAKGRSF